MADVADLWLQNPKTRHGRRSLLLLIVPHKHSHASPSTSSHQAERTMDYIATWEIPRTIFFKRQRVCTRHGLILLSRPTNQPTPPISSSGGRIGTDAEATASDLDGWDSLGRSFGRLIRSSRIRFSVWDRDMTRSVVFNSERSRCRPRPVDSVRKPFPPSLLSRYFSLPRSRRL